MAEIFPRRWPLLAAALPLLALACRKKPAPEAPAKTEPPPVQAETPAEQPQEMPMPEAVPQPEPVPEAQPQDYQPEPVYSRPSRPSSPAAQSYSGTALDAQGRPVPPSAPVVHGPGNP